MITPEIGGITLPENDPGVAARAACRATWTIPGGRRARARRRARYAERTYAAPVVAELIEGLLDEAIASSASADAQARRRASTPSRQPRRAADDRAGRARRRRRLHRRSSRVRWPRRDGRSSWRPPTIIATRRCERCDGAQRLPLRARQHAARETRCAPAPGSAAPSTGCASWLALPRLVTTGAATSTRPHAGLGDHRRWASPRSRALRLAGRRRSCRPRTTPSSADARASHAPRTGPRARAAHGAHDRAHPGRPRAACPEHRAGAWS